MVVFVSVMCRHLVRLTLKNCHKFLTQQNVIKNKTCYCRTRACQRKRIAILCLLETIEMHQPFCAKNQRVSKTTGHVASTGGYLSAKSAIRAVMESGGRNALSAMVHLSASMGGSSAFAYNAGVHPFASMGRSSGDAKSAAEHRAACTGG